MSEEQETPLHELLRRVPKEAEELRQDGSVWQSIPYGFLCHEAADEIERLRAALRLIAETPGDAYDLRQIARSALTTGDTVRPSPDERQWTPIDVAKPKVGRGVLVWSPSNLTHYMASWDGKRFRPWVLGEQERVGITHWRPVGNPPETTKDTAQDPGFYDPRLPRFYAESRCSQCGHPEEHIKRTGCPEKCGREPLVVKERAQTDAWPRRPDGRCAFCGAPPGEPHKFRCTPSLARAALEKGNG